MKNKILGGAAAVAVGALALPGAASAQQSLCPPGVTNPEYCIGGSDSPEEWVDRALQLLADKFGIPRDQLRVVRFNGAIMVTLPRGGAGGGKARAAADDGATGERSELRSDDGLIVGMMLCTREQGCETAANVKYVLGGRTFYNKKSAELLRNGEFRTIRVKVPAAHRGLLRRSTVIKVATTTRLRDPRSKAVLGKAKRQMRVGLR